MKIKIEVTQEDIDKGTRRDSQRCMAAQCLLRMYPDSDVAVGSFAIWVDNKAFIPDETFRQKINAYDYGMVVEPFTAELEKVS